MQEAKILILNELDLCKNSKHKDFSDITISDFYFFDEAPNTTQNFDYVVYKTNEGCKPLKQRHWIITEWLTA